MRFWIKLGVIVLLFTFLAFWLPGTIADYRAYRVAAENQRRSIVEFEQAMEQGHGHAPPDVTQRQREAQAAFSRAVEKWDRRFGWLVRHEGTRSFQGNMAPGDSKPLAV